jgi:hypothetical protein
MKLFIVSATTAADDPCILINRRPRPEAHLGSQAIEGKRARRLVAIGSSVSRSGATGSPSKCNSTPIAPELATNDGRVVGAMKAEMIDVLRFAWGLVVDAVRGRAGLLAENAMLRQQLIVAQRKLRGRV